MGQFTVVLTSCRPPAAAGAALRALKPQCLRRGVELVVARAWSSDSPEVVELRDGCRVVRCVPDARRTELRGRGLAAADTEWVAVTEDTCVADSDWLAQLMAAANSDTDVLGGAIAVRSPADRMAWGAFFSEYGFYAGTGRRGLDPASPAVAMASVAYRNSVAARVTARSLSGEWEDVIHRELAGCGARFGLAPNARVRFNYSGDAGAFCLDRFEHGRAYATRRGASVSAAARALLALRTPALPVVLAGRLARLAGRDGAGMFVAALPGTLLFLSAWSAGEAAGYLGEGGTA